MSASLAIAVVQRDELSAALLGGYKRDGFRNTRLDQVTELSPPKRGAIVGYWRVDDRAFFPDFMIVRDDELNDTLAWTSSFLNSFTPISQWCRVWKQSQFNTLTGPLGNGLSSANLGIWIGTIVAECSAQGLSNAILRDLSGTAALTSASYGAARAVSVWGALDDFGELARRHDDLSAKFREETRPISATQLLPLWYSIAATAWTGKEPVESGPLRVFSQVFDGIGQLGDEAPERASEIVAFVADVFGLPDLIACASGPQPQRVDALDRLAKSLLAGPTSPVIEGVLGFGASLVDLGAVVLPELLKRYTATYPVAPIWAGAFAGAWSARRVMSEFNGLGRLIAKEVIKPSDLFAQPLSDIAYDELVRWLSPSHSTKVPVRGMVTRTLNVELLPGVSAAFPIGRQSTSKNEPQSAERQRNLELEDPKRSDRSVSQSSSSPTVYLARQLDDLVRRVELLEKERPLAKPASKGSRRKA